MIDFEFITASSLQRWKDEGERWMNKTVGFFENFIIDLWLERWKDEGEKVDE